MTIQILTSLSVFFANADDDKDKEFIVMTTNTHRLQYLYEGTHYNVSFYDAFSAKSIPKKLIAVHNKVTELFSDNFEGLLDDEYQTAQFKSAADVKTTLKIRLLPMKKYVMITTLFIVLGCQESKKGSPASLTTDTVINTITAQQDTIPDFSKEEISLTHIQKQIDRAFGNLRNDSLIQVESEKFTKQFATFIEKNEKTLYYPFDSLQTYPSVRITTSADAKLRVYSWDNNSGGTMRFFNQMYQYQTSQEIKTEIKLSHQDPQSFFSKIYTVHTAEHQPIYLVISNGIYSTSDITQSVTAYEIKGNNLKKKAVFKTKKTLLNEINVPFNFRSVVDRPERPVEVITLQNNILKVAYVKEDGEVTSKHLLYEWDGNLFQYKGVQ